MISRAGSGRSGRAGGVWLLVWFSVACMVCGVRPGALAYRSPGWRGFGCLCSPPPTRSPAGPRALPPSSVNKRQTRARGVRGDQSPANTPTCLPGWPHLSSWIGVLSPSSNATQRNGRGAARSVPPLGSWVPIWAYTNNDFRGIAQRPDRAEHLGILGRTSVLIDDEINLSRPSQA